VRVQFWGTRGSLATPGRLRLGMEATHRASRFARHAEHSSLSTVEPGDTRSLGSSRRATSSAFAETF
jgi:hypothetical protein